MSSDTPMRIYCNMCKRFTKHDIIFHRRFEYDIASILYYTDTFTWACAGCEEITYQTAFSKTSDLDDNGNPKILSWYFPERSLQYLSIKVFVKLPENLNNLYNEIITAFNKRCFILSSMGLRSLLEGICKDKGIEGATLEKLIDNMKFITDSIKKNLHGLRVMGNAAIHELDSLTRDEIIIAIEVMEDLMNYVYELDYKSSRMLQIVNEKHQSKTIPDEVIIGKEPIV